MTISEQVPLAEHTSLRIGGPARHWADIADPAEVPQALAWASERRLPWTVIGDGTNLLVSDDGFDGVVLHLTSKSTTFSNDGLVCADAGARWDDLVAACVTRGWAGVERLSGIPGTVGATPVQNVGAYGQEVADTLVRVHAWDTRTGVHVALPAAECGFTYRASRFNQDDAARFVITAVEFQLRRGDPKQLAAIREETLVTRRAKGMVLEGDAPESRSAGSFFKNPLVTPGTVAAITRRAGAAPPQFPSPGGNTKIPAAWLIEHAGFAKGYRPSSSGVGLSRLHSLAIVNYEHGTAAQVHALAREIQSAVAAHFDVQLAREPVALGDEPPRTGAGQAKR